MFICLFKKKKNISKGLSTELQWHSEKPQVYAVAPRGVPREACTTIIF